MIDAGLRAKAYTVGAALAPKPAPRTVSAEVVLPPAGGQVLVEPAPGLPWILAFHVDGLSLTPGDRVRVEVADNIWTVVAVLA